jgi:predicted DNA-binding antitoxin AbrB/MazE fold protein
MATIVKAVYVEGVLKPEEPVRLEEHKSYVLSIEPATEQGAVEDDDPTGWKTARRFIGLWKEAPADDLAENHDAYLYDRRD